ncbi:MAG: polyprenyl synthetase family protein [Gemmatimonadota bacterium]
MERILGPIRDEMDRFERRLDERLRSDVVTVHEVARYMATLRGKRLRPALVVLTARATGLWRDEIVEAITDAGVGVEMIHAATVVHDDVVDSALTRRGKASVNSRWDNQIAVLMGDFLLARALCILVALGNQKALMTVSRATERLSQGEIHELQIGRQADTREGSYFAMVSDKTASLIAASCKIGPLLVGAGDQVVAAMTRYGEALGLAFQIADDLLDFTGDPDALGKPVGHDLREGKITLPVIHALAAAPPAARDAMEKVLRRRDRSEVDWSAMAAFVEEHGGLQSAAATARQYARQAQDCLEVLAPSPYRAALETAVRLVVERQS